MVYREETINKRKNSTTKRVAVKIQPYSSLINFLRRLLARPGFTPLLRDSTAEVGCPAHPDDFIMMDIHDGDA